MNRSKRRVIKKRVLSNYHDQFITEAALSHHCEILYQYSDGLCSQSVTIVVQAMLR